MRVQSFRFWIGSLALLLYAGIPGRAQQTAPPKSSTDKPSAQTTPSAKPPAPTAADLDSKGDSLLSANKPDEAIAAFRQAVILSPKDIRGYIGLGTACMQSKRYTEAVQAFRTAVDLNPDAADFHFKLGGALLEAAQYAEARTAFERAVELDPNNISYRLSIGDSYLREKDYAGARQALLDALGYSPDSPDVHTGLGNVDLQDNHYTEALDEFDAVLRTDLSNADANARQALTTAATIGRASALSGLKRFDEAEKIMRDLLAHNPKSADVQSGLAQVLDSAGKHDEAIAAYRAALQITPDDPDLWGNLGWAQYNAGRYEDAVASSRKALQYDPKLAYVRFNLGLVFAVQDRWKESQQEYRAALAVAVTPDIQGGLDDVRHALVKQPRVRALRQAFDFLTSAEREAWQRVFSNSSAPLSGTPEPTK